MEPGAGSPVTAPDAVRDPWPLTGRRAELDLLRRAVEHGRGVVLAGAAGVGKTRLARETEALAAAAGAHVERVVASRSAAGIPLGAFAPVDVGAGTGPSSLGALRRRLMARASGTRLVLIVDDAHALDDASAVLVHQLSATGNATVVATVRTREPTPSAVVALWKDDLCERVEVQPLSRIEITELLTAVLGGPIESATGHAMWERSRGNVMYLRELVRGGTASGSLAVRSGVWTWDGAYSKLGVGGRHELGGVLSA